MLRERELLVHTGSSEGNVGVGGLVSREKDKLGSSSSKANHSLREAGKLLESQRLEDGGVELNGRSKAGLCDVEENVSDRHFEGCESKRCVR